MRASVAVARATTRARVLTRATTSRRVVLARAGKPPAKEKGFFEADLANDLKSVSSDDIVDALRAGDALAYVGVGGLVANVVTLYSLWVLAHTGCGLPAGPGGVLGGAEGVSFLVALVGLGVLANQLLHFGYVPEAVPVEGGQCFGK